MTPTEQQENEIREAWNAYAKTANLGEHFILSPSEWVNFAVIRNTAWEKPFMFRIGHAAAMQKREEETKAIEWCLGKSGEEIVVQMAALQENAKAYYRVKLELAAAKEMGENLVEALRSQTPSRCTTAYELREEALAAYEASWKGRGV